MAGSITYRAYTADNGTTYSVRVDESNGTAFSVSAAGSLLPVRTANFPLLPRGTKMRYVNTTLSTNPNIKRRFKVGTAGSINAVLQPGATITAQVYPTSDDAVGTSATFIVNSYRGEESLVPPSFTAPDTGLTDGTVSQ